MTSTIVLGGFTTDGLIDSGQTINPFVDVTVADSFAVDDSATVSFTAAKGVLSGVGLSADVTSSGVATYALSAKSPATLQSELRALVFTPAAQQTSSVTTAFDLTVTDVSASPPVAPSQTLSSGVSGPYSVTTDAAGDVFVANTDDTTIEEFSGVGALLRTLSSGVDDPESVATDAAGDVFVANNGADTVEKFSGAGVLLATLSSGVDEPTSVATDADDDVFVANSGDDTVEEFSGAGALLRMLSSGINSPEGVATDAAGDVFVANTLGNSVEEFSSTGALLATLTNGVSGPMSVATDAHGDVFVANAFVDTVEDFSPTGALLATLSSGIDDPVSVATDSQGDVYVANFSGDTVEEFSGSGVLLRRLSSGIDSPNGVSTDAQGDVFVADLDGDTVEEFAPAGVSRTSNSTTSVTVTKIFASTLAGTVADQTTTEEAAIHPFSGVVVGDLNTGARDTLTITMTGAGGALAGSGLTPLGEGVYTLTGAASALTSQLDALVFTSNAGSPGAPATTSFALSDVNTSDATPVGATTSVVDSDIAPLAPELAVSGFTANGAIFDNQTIDPFAGVTVTEALGVDVSAIIAFSAAKGTLSGAGLSAGVTRGGVATYTLSAATAATLQSELQAIAFAPTVQGALGSTVTTAFDLIVTDKPASPVLTPSLTLANGINAPEGVAIDAAGDIFVANDGDKTIEEFSSTGALLRTLTSGIMNPASVAVDATGDLFVSDQPGKTVEEFSPTGTLLRTLTSGLKQPYSLATDAAGDLFVADLFAYDVEEFSSAGALLRTLSTGSAYPDSVATDAAGDVFVGSYTGSEVSTVQEFSSTGALLRTLADGIDYPDSLATDAAGDVFVANVTSETVKEFSSTGALLRTLSSGINHPSSLATDAAGDVFVANNTGDTVEEFSPTGALFETFSTGGDAPYNLATDAAGDVFVTLQGNKVEEFAAVGSSTVSNSTTSVAVTAVATTSAPSILGLKAATDSGTPGDSKTDDATPTIDGTALGDALVTVYIDGGHTPLGTTTSDGGGAWSYSFGSALSLGGHIVTATTTLDSATSPPSTAYDFTIDAAPLVSSIDTVGANPNDASSEQWTVTFSQPVTGVNSSDFTVATTTAAGGPTLTDTGVSSVTGSGTTYTVTVGGVAGDGALGLNLNANSTDVTDGAGDAVTAAFTGESFTIKPTPKIEDVSDYIANQASLDLWPPGIDIVDTSANVAGALSILNADPHIDQITLTDSGAPTLTLTLAEALDDLLALSKITNSPYNIAITDTTADLEALTVGQINALAALPVVSLGSTDASVVIDSVQSQALRAGNLSVAAPANDYVEEGFANGALEISTFAANGVVDRLATRHPDGSTEVRQYDMPGSIWGVSYKGWDASFTSAGAITLKTFYASDGSVAATQTFSANEDFTLTIPNEPTLIKTVAADGATQFAHTGIANQPYTSDQSDYSPAGMLVAQSLDNVGDSGQVRIYGSELTISSQGTIGPTGGADEFAFTNHATETYNLLNFAVGDVFSFAATGFGTVTINSFEASDALNLAALFTSYADLQAHESTSGAGLTLTDHLAGDAIVLPGVSALSLTAQRTGF